MFSSMRKWIGNIHVVEEGNFVTIEGLPTYQYMNDMSRIWRTSKIGMHLFNKVTASSVSFNKFFVPEVIYTLEGVLNGPRRGNGFNYRAMRKTIDELKEHTWFKGTLEPKPSILDYRQLGKLNVELLPHQFEFLKAYDQLVPQYNLNGYMLGAVPGSGKTLNALALGLCLHANAIICIVPKNSTEKVWSATCENFFKETPSFWSSTRSEPLVAGKQIYIFHYEQLDRAIEFFKKYKPHNPMVILDESHNMNEADSLRTQLFIQLCRDVLACKNVLWVSGTPIKAIGNEAIPFLCTIDPFFNKNAEERFRKIFGKSSSKAVDILANRIGYLIFKVEKSTIIKNEVQRFNKDVILPHGKVYTLDSIRADMQAFVAERMMYYEKHKKMYTDQYEAGLRAHEKMIEHDKKKQELYARYRRYIELIIKQYDPELMKEESKFCNWYEAKEIGAYLSQPLKEQFRNAKSVVKYYHLKVQGEALGRVLGKKRMQCNVDMVDAVDFEIEIDGARKKSIIFTSYVEVVDRAFNVLTEKGYKPLRVYGETNKDLSNILTQFEKDPDANPLIATFQSLSTAVPLVMASTAMMMNSPFRVGELEQTEARIDRIGQDGEVTFINYFLKTGDAPNISTRSGDILQWSKEQVAAIMGEPVPETVLALEQIFEPKTNALSTEAFADDYCVLVEVCYQGYVEVMNKPIYSGW